MNVSREMPAFDEFSETRNFVIQHVCFCMYEVENNKYIKKYISFVAEASHTYFPSGNGFDGKSKCQ